MPRPALPPTPISSTDITAKDGLNLSSLELSFTLPPPAIARENGSRSSTSSAASSSASSYRPVSPGSPLATTTELTTSRKRSAAAAAKEDFALPPPPTRSRKIIQMKPRPEAEPPVQQPVTPSARATSNKSSGAPAASQAAAASKRKQPSATSVAGRKIARKTAHSLIERRRRSKMNEEFGVLKQMIPACRDQDMHKLAILQASIDYLRYLEQCISDLKANNNTQSTPAPPTRPSQDVADNDNDNDISMPSDDSSCSASSEPNSPHITSQSQTRQQDVPPLPTLTPPSRDSSQRHTSFSTTPGSPALPPQSAASTSTSPTLLPRRDVDQEATEALLLLNTADRRGVSSSGRRMSVRDLLSG